MSEDVIELDLEPGKGRLPARLVWLADAPLYIDADQVNRFYDAVVRPNATQEGTRAPRGYRATDMSYRAGSGGRSERW